MKRNIPFCLMSLLVMAGCAVESDRFVTFTEADDPVAVSERSMAAWDEVGRLEAVWASADSLYSRSEVPVVAPVAVNRLSGWKGERVSAQFLLQDQALRGSDVRSGILSLHLL